MAGRCSPQQIKRYSHGGAVSTSDDNRSDPRPRNEPKIGTMGPNASRPRGSTGGGLNAVPAADSGAPASRTPPRTKSSGLLNENTLLTVPAARRDQEREVLGYKKGGVIPPAAKLPGAARRMGAQFGQGKGESAMKPEGKKSPPPVGAKPTKGTFGQGSGPVKQRSSAPIRKKFI